jgi:ADP-ribosylglycohydrolase
LNDSKGCGGVMRTAPAGLIAADDPFALGCDLAAITHSHPAGYLSAGFLAHLIHEVVAGHTLRDAVPAGLRRLGSEAETDSTGAITGNILGARLGLPAIPTRWLSGWRRTAGTPCLRASWPW